ncbi:MAG: hypothetical protein H6986_11390 [Pseudomonadales bacterium]|nr:hypothetical protein [Pseudomonadales bacterium]
MQFLEQNGFQWTHLREIFPFGAVELREGNYQRLLVKSVETCKTDEDRALLLDLLDAQACIFLEQVWAQNEQLGGCDKPPFLMHAHFSSAWLQINSNIRREYSLPSKNGRQMMLNLLKTETLFDRMLNPVTEIANEEVGQ